MHGSVCRPVSDIHINQVGLAVDDIKGIQDAAVLRRLALQVCIIRNCVVNNVLF